MPSAGSARPTAPMRSCSAEAVEAAKARNSAPRRASCSSLASASSDAAKLVMKIVVVRHAIAAEKAKFRESGKPYSARQLTAEGRRLFRSQLPHMREVIGGLDVIYTSPFLRAHETAELLQGHHPDAKIVALDSLEP